MLFRLILAIALLTPHGAYAQNAIQEENSYLKIAAQLKIADANLEKISASSGHSKLFVDALWDLISTEENVNTVIRLKLHLKALLDKEGGISSFEFADQIRLQLLANDSRQTKLTPQTQKILREKFQGEKLDVRSLAVLNSYKSRLDRKGLEFIWSEKPEERFRVKTKSEIQDLFYNTPDLSTYENGKFRNGIRLFMFCRQNRVYPCRLLMKDRNNQPIFQGSGQSLWNQPSLGLSKLGLPYNQRNGNTPSGVYTIESVMPEANFPLVYGKNRRLILEFIPSSTDELLHHQFLPESALTARWWHEAVKARNVGRNLLRVHGTGVIKTTPQDPNHPLRPTLGCIMQREGSADNETYQDQRHLLDTMMLNLNLPAEFENETQILGAFYVIDLDNQKRSVTLQDLENYLDI